MYLGIFKALMINNNPILTISITNHPGCIITDHPSEVRANNIAAMRRKLGVKPWINPFSYAWYKYAKIPQCLKYFVKKRVSSSELSAKC